MTRERETVPILVRPRDDESGTVSDRAEGLSLTFATPVMDRSARSFAANTRSTEIKSKYIYR